MLCVILIIAALGSFRSALGERCLGVDAAYCLSRCFFLFVRGRFVFQCALGKLFQIYIQCFPFCFLKGRRRWLICASRPA
jgi:hypothetical protein